MEAVCICISSILDIDELAPAYKSSEKVHTSTWRRKKLSINNRSALDDFSLEFCAAKRDYPIYSIKEAVPEGIGSIGGTELELCPVE